MKSVNKTTGFVALFRAAKATLTSEGWVTVAGLVPREYRADRGTGVDVAVFDWEAGKVTLSSASPNEVALTAGAQDVLSMFYQLGIQLHTGGIRKLSIATGRKFEAYNFDTVGEEQLELITGPQRTLHLNTRAEPGADITEIWLGLDLSGLPLQIRHADRGGEVFYQTADKIEIGDRDTPQEGTR
jgi:hypothetical protein